MTLQTQKFQQQQKKKSDIFGRKFWENILTHFQKFSAKIFRFWSKNDWFYKILEKLKKQIFPNGKFGLVAPVKQALFPWPRFFGRSAKRVPLW